MKFEPGGKKHVRIDQMERQHCTIDDVLEKCLKNYQEMM